MDSNGWFSWKTHPTDGVRFLAWDGEEMFVCNHPKGHALGEWTKGKRKRYPWCGAARFLPRPATHWRPCPPVPVGEEKARVMKESLEGYKLVCYPPLSHAEWKALSPFAKKLMGLSKEKISKVLNRRKVRKDGTRYKKAKGTK